MSPSEVAQVLGTSAEYKVSEVADRLAEFKSGVRRLKKLQLLVWANVWNRCRRTALVTVLNFPLESQGTLTLI
ncbi:MAG TPA: hypothetical protein VKE24_13270 [Candidatus Acidoferrales bacterium]|nr:hypothetical protein [Candidatus Acidoferrales bacterium]